MSKSERLAAVKRVSEWLADYDDNAAQLYEEGNASDDNLAEFDRDDIRTILSALAAPPQVEPAEGEALADDRTHELISRAVDLACNHLIFYDQHFDVEARQKFYDIRDAMRQWLIDQADTALTSQSAELLSLRRKVEETEAERDVFQGLLKEEFRVSADRAEQIMALKRALEPFGRNADASSLARVYAHLTREHAQTARALAGDRP